MSFIYVTHVGRFIDNFVHVKKYIIKIATEKESFPIHSLYVHNQL